MAYRVGQPSRRRHKNLSHRGCPLLATVLGGLLSMGACVPTGLCWQDRHCPGSTCDTSLHLCRSGAQDPADLSGTSSGGDMSRACTGWPSTPVSPLSISGRSPMPIKGDGFGSAILVAGSDLLIGAPGLGGGVGGVFVLKRSGTQYAQDALLQAAVLAAGQRVGATLSGTPTTLFAGPDLDGGGSEGVYRFSKAATWGPGTLITANTSGIKFGAAVAFDGTYPAYVGATTDDGKGAVYAVGETAGMPTQLMLSTSNGALFGHALTLLADSVIVGAPFEKDALTMAPDFGRAYVYLRNFQAGSPPSFDPPDSVQGANFGAALAAKGNTLLVGVDANSIKKAVHVFRRNGAGQPFAFMATIAGGAGAKFGSTVALITEDLAAVSDPGAGASGTVYLYDLGPLRTKGLPVRLQEIVPAAEVPAAVLFGKALSVSASGETLYVGAPGTNQSSGRVYGVECTR